MPIVVEFAEYIVPVMSQIMALLPDIAQNVPAAGTHPVAEQGEIYNFIILFTAIH